MPQFLKSKTIQRLRVAQHALEISVREATTPRPSGYAPASHEFAIAVGLVGVAAELSVTACLFEVLGERALFEKGSKSQYVSAREALARFRKMLASGIPKLSRLTKGTKDANKHLEELNSITEGFPVLFSARALGLHAGEGSTPEVVLQACDQLARFLVKLAESPHWEPYIRDVVIVPKLERSRTLIAQELASLASSDPGRNGGHLAGIFIILPEVLSTQPQWLEDLDKVHVVPRKDDIAVLASGLKAAAVASIQKVGSGTTAMPVQVVPKGTPGALPFYPEAMKSSFEKPLDHWRALVGTANATLKKHGKPTLPSPADVCYFFALGLAAVGFPEEELEAGLTAHQVWPFIAASIGRQGTPGPVFFLSARTASSEAGQLLAQLKAAAKQAPILRRRVEEYEAALESSVRRRPFDPNSALVASMQNEFERRETLLERLVPHLKERSKHASGKEAGAINTCIGIIEEEGHLGAPLRMIAEKKLALGAQLFPVLRDLIDSASDREEIEPLLIVGRDSDLNSAVQTNIRKALVALDFALYGKSTSLRPTASAKRTAKK